MDTALTFKMLGCQSRLDIFMLLCERGGLLNVSEIVKEIDLEQSTISIHLKELRTVGIIKVERKGLYAYYSVCPEKIEELISFLGYACMKTNIRRIG